MNELEQLFGEIIRLVMKGTVSSGVSPSQFFILKLLDKHPLSVTELAEKLDISLSAITNLSNKMVTSGVIAREHLSEDRRVVQLSITSEGKIKLNEMKEKSRKLMAHIHQHLTLTEKTMLIKVYQKIIENYKKEVF